MTKKQWQYRQFLKTPFWREMSAMKRRMVTCCERCASRQELQCHHRVYRAEWTDTRMEDLEVVCRTCHEKEHGLHDPEFEAFAVQFWCRGALSQMMTERLWNGKPLLRRQRKAFRRAVFRFRGNGGISLLYERACLMHQAIISARARGVRGYDLVVESLEAMRPTVQRLK